MEEGIKQVLEVLSRVRGDTMTPRGARGLVEQAIGALSGGDRELGVATAISYLDKAGNHPNLPPHIRTAIWNALGILEGLSKKV